MSNKRPTETQIIELLQQPHFRSESRQELSAPGGSIDLVDVLEVDPFDANPRHIVNTEAYAELKASIASVGVEQAIVISRRPGADRYMVYGGGNTRLRIMLELWKETGAERYRFIPCRYVPWVSDTDALLRHMKENEKRHGLVFIDRALAVRELRNKIEAETDQNLSLRAFAEALAERGYTVDPGTITRLDYAVDTLYGAIPQALSAGMGRRHIDGLRSLDNAFTAAWQSLDLDSDEGTAKAIFIEVLSRKDNKQIDLDAVRRALEAELSVTADIEVQRASLIFGASLGGRDPGSTARLSTDQEANDTPDKIHNQDLQDQFGHSDTSDTQSPEAQNDNKDHQDSEPKHETSPGEKVPDKDEHRTTDHRRKSSYTERQQTLEDRIEGRLHDPEPLLAAMRNLRTELPNVRLEQLRRIAAQCALKAARDALVEDIILPIDDGVGFLVQPALFSKHWETFDADFQERVFFLWWLLAQVSEQFATGSKAHRHMPANWVGTAMEAAMNRDPREHFGDWLAQNRGPDTWGYIPPTPLPDYGPQCWSKLPPESWEGFVELVEVYRAIGLATNHQPWD
jgi:ParB family protein of integrating conjugative element (PFGI_1 class)